MKAKRRWRGMLLRANRLVDCVTTNTGWQRCPLKGVGWSHLVAITHRDYASMALDGMPSTPKRPRAVRKGRP